MAPYVLADTMHAPVKKSESTMYMVTVTQCLLTFFRIDISPPIRSLSASLRRRLEQVAGDHVTPADVYQWRLDCLHEADHYRLFRPLDLFYLSGLHGLRRHVALRRHPGEEARCLARKLFPLLPTAAQPYLDRALLGLGHQHQVVER